MTPEIRKPFIPLTTDEVSFADKCAHAAYIGAMPMDAAKVMGEPIEIEGYGVVRLADHPINRGARAIYDAFPDDRERAISAIARLTMLFPLVEKPPLKKWTRLAASGDFEIDPVLYTCLCAIPFTLADVASRKRAARLASGIAKAVMALKAADADG